MIHFTYTTHVQKATDLITKNYKKEIKDSVISFEDLDYCVVTDQDVAESIAYDLDNLDIPYDAEQDCDECCGDGIVEIRDCHDSSNECCGGCFKDLVCDYCDSGKILFI